MKMEKMQVGFFLVRRTTTTPQRGIRISYRSIPFYLSIILRSVLADPRDCA